MNTLFRRPISLNTAINLIILSSGSCLALCLYLLGPGYPAFTSPAFEPASLATALPTPAQSPSGIHR